MTTLSKGLTPGETDRFAILDLSKLASGLVLTGRYGVALLLPHLRKGLPCCGVLECR